MQVIFQPADHLRIQVVGGLVQQKQIRRVHQGGGQGHPLALTAGQSAHFLIHVFNAQPGENFHRLIPGDFPGSGVKTRLHLLHNRVFRVKGRVLGQISQADVGVVADGALIRGFHPGGQPEEGGFAAAVDTHDTHPVS